MPGDGGADTQAGQALPGIDLLRGVAVLLVVLFHLHRESGVPVVDAIWEPFRAFGWSGVDLFFVISGFCIHWGYGQPGRRFAPWSYLRRRFRRIYPPYLIAVAISALVLAIAVLLRGIGRGSGPGYEVVSLCQLGTHFLLIHNLWPETAVGINPALWTIAIEFQFYLVYLAFRPLLQRWGWLAAFALSLAAHSAAHQLVAGSVPEVWNVFKYWLEWVIGAAVAELYRRKLRPRFTWPLFLSGAALLLGLMALGPAATTLMRPLWAVGFALLVLGVLWGPQGYLVQWPGLVLIRLGTISYSVYLIHLPMFQRIDHYVVARFDPGFGRLVAMLLTLALVVGASAIFYQLCERPFLNTKHRSYAQPGPVAERPGGIAA